MIVNGETLQRVSSSKGWEYDIPGFKDMEELRKYAASRIERALVSPPLRFVGLELKARYLAQFHKLRKGGDYGRD